MKKTLIIANEQVRNRAALIIQTIPIEPAHEIVIREHKVDRSAAQKGYYFYVAGEVAKYVGWSKADAHKWYKLNILKSIYMADPNMKEYHSRIEAIVGAMEPGIMSMATAEDLMAEVTSTNNAKMHHMREYISDVLQHAESLGVRVMTLGEWER